jgi:hypothetical protein
VMRSSDAKRELRRSSAWTCAAAASQEAVDELLFPERFFPCGKIREPSDW